MIKVENIDVWGWKHAIRGMRNPLASWDKSDSLDYCPAESDECINCIFSENGECTNYDAPIIGDNDLALMQKLYKAGESHRKYLRQVFVSMDITAPLYMLKQLDTYKVGVTMNSTSTMHTIHKKEFTLDDFSHEHLIGRSWSEADNFKGITPLENLKNTIDLLNDCRKLYLFSKGTNREKMAWWQIIQSLPDSYNQLRTVTMNYENVVNIINQRRGHRLDEWNTFCDILRDLPYVKEIMNE